ncbi:MAG: hypothetical protein E7583_06990 [Ruminococcaceae bacterium]|nr:hypothetical protein [Oscillospiraceae bacterium]
MELNFPYKMMVAGHKGNCVKKCENTMPAFIAAVEDGADMIECDVRLTKDLVPVLMHDDTLERTTLGTGKICEMTYEELLQVNTKRSPEGVHVHIPKLEELLILLRDNNVMLNLEIKEYYKNGENRERCEKCCDLCVELIEKYGMGDKMVFNSFDAYVLEYIEEKHPKKYLHHGFYPYTIMGNVKRNPDEYLFCACIFDDGNKALYDELIKKGIQPWVGAGVKTKEHLEKCLEFGARLVTTDNPEVTLQQLSELGVR